ncbi:uncharacterized protein LOC121367332 [Gigantopelta aegis]|uniref:uncharacterized protein LOC121367332 n=1 Tax=Gigantopelta aegis TaxID=1735272 RepID=UPI001B888548|nr:uncharacterized protein LOC121367332 [Gigantopelta aegis]
MLKTLTVCLLSLFLLVQVQLVSGGHPLGHSTDGESEKGPPPSFRKPLGLLGALGYGDDVILHRHIRAAGETTTVEPPEEKDTWTKIGEFYADNNNMAMYLVLPLIILVYGGCSVIYCVAKCRRYMKRQHQKKIREDKMQLNPEDKNDLNHDEEAPSYDAKQTYPTALSSPNFTNDVNYNRGSTSGTPLPSQVPDDENHPPKCISPVNATVIDPHNKLDSRMSHKEVDVSRKTYRDIFAARDNNLAEANENGSLTIVDKSGMPVKNDDPAIPMTLRTNSMGTTPSANGRESTLSYKEELLAKYDALSTFAMAKKAADILRMTPNKEKDPFATKGRRKVIYIAE